MGSASPVPCLPTADEKPFLCPLSSALKCPRSFGGPRLLSQGSSAERLDYVSCCTAQKGEVVLYW